MGVGDGWFKQCTQCTIGVQPHPESNQSDLGQMRLHTFCALSHTCARVKHTLGRSPTLHHGTAAVCTIVLKLYNKPLSTCIPCVLDLEESSERRLGGV